MSQYSESPHCSLSASCFTVLIIQREFIVHSSGYMCVLTLGSHRKDKHGLALLSPHEQTLHNICRHVGWGWWWGGEALLCNTVTMKEGIWGNRTCWTGRCGSGRHPGLVSPQPTVNGAEPTVNFPPHPLCRTSRSCNRFSHM